MNSTQITTIAEKAGQRYILFLASLTATYLQAVHSSHPESAVTRNLALKRAYQAAELFLDNEKSQINFALTEERIDALTFTQEDIELGDLMTDNENCSSVEHVALIGTELENALRVQMERDVASMMRAIRNLALRAQLTGKSRGVSSRDAMAQLQQENTSPTFTYQDRAGRRWLSQKLVKTLYRQALVFVWNETAMLEMVDRGVTHAIIDHPDTNHPERGTVVALTEQPTVDTVIWEAVRDEVFHPNSSSFLRSFASIHK